MYIYICIYIYNPKKPYVLHYLPLKKQSFIRPQETSAQLPSQLQLAAEDSSPWAGKPQSYLKLRVGLRMVQKVVKNGKEW